MRLASALLSGTTAAIGAACSAHVAPADDATGGEASRQAELLCDVQGIDGCI